MPPNGSGLHRATPFLEFEDSRRCSRCERVDTTPDFKLTHYPIFDLLDNSLDGIHRGRLGGTSKIRPYTGFYAEIEFKGNQFFIHDNCGGIPVDLLDYAFRMGTPKDRKNEGLGTVGTYGIGMKRAIFKIGHSCIVSTQNAGVAYEVELSPQWMDNDDDWDLFPRKIKRNMKEDGTTILISQIHPGVSAQFGHDKVAFEADLRKRISMHYAFIISRGFEILVNGVPVEPRPTELLFSSGTSRTHRIRPYIYESRIKDVDVFLAIGFVKPTQTADIGTNDDDQKGPISAGWTVVCNERAVLYGDKTELTGWGEGDLPQFHPQYNSIAGIVEFSSKFPEHLPTTTTKRGIDTSSRLYLQVKNRMREGARLFVDYTNWWKGDIAESKATMAKTESLLFEELKKRSKELPMRALKKAPGGRQYKPSLPKPAAKEPSRIRIAFMKDRDRVRQVGAYLLDDPTADPNKIGGLCFDEIYRASKK